VSTTGARVVVDTDPGIDDALALLLALRSPECRIEAITTVAGNVPVDVGTANVARILGVARPATPPVVGTGQAEPLMRPLVTATEYHGEDGLGGLASELPEARLDRDTGHAASLLVQAARRWGAELTVVALGPLTNLALAVEQDVDALRAVRQIVVMGGSAAVGGNVTPAAEFNIFVDPEAAARVFDAGLPLTLVPLDVTMQVVWSPERIGRLADGADSVGRFARALAERAIARPGGDAGVVMHDPLAVGVALDPSLVQALTLPVAVETAGTLTRGMTVVDRRPAAASGGGRSGCRVALAVDAERFLRLFEERVCRASA
jgi:inosine-uridine nucleoside N-ribohydrolase